MAQEVDALKALKTFREQFDTLGDCALALAVSKQYLSDMLHARRDPSERILKRLGLKRAVVRDRGDSQSA